MATDTEDLYWLTDFELDELIAYASFERRRRADIADRKTTRQQQLLDFGPEGRTPEMEANQIADACDGGPRCHLCGGSGRDSRQNWCDICLGVGNVPRKT